MTSPLQPGQIVTGNLFNEPMRIETVAASGTDTWAVGLVGVQTERFRKVTLTSSDLEKLTILHTGFKFNGDGRLLRLGLQAYSLGIAYEFDPYFGLSISRVGGTILLTPNERRVAEDRRDCYWLYVVTDCGSTPCLQEPICDPARFEWNEVTKVSHYY
jgi:hypothetical protein